MPNTEKGAEIKRFAFKPGAIYTMYSGPFKESLTFNDDCLDEFRERVGETKNSLLIITSGENFRNILVSPLPYYKILAPDPINKVAVLTIYPSAIDINVQEAQREHDGGQDFYREEFETDLRVAVTNSLRKWGEWEIDSREDKNLFQKALRKKQLDNFFTKNRHLLFQPSAPPFLKPVLAPEPLT